MQKVALLLVLSPRLLFLLSLSEALFVGSRMRQLGSYATSWGNVFIRHSGECINGYTAAA